MSYWRLFYHVVWATKDRLPLIDDGRRESIDRTIRAACHEDGVLLHAIEMMPDHLHVAISVPPRLAIASVVRRLKSASSLVINRAADGREDAFAWQSEYGVLSFGERSLPDVVAYIENQRAHHAARSLRPSFELTERPFQDPATNRDHS